MSKLDRRILALLPGLALAAFAALAVLPAAAAPAAPPPDLVLGPGDLRIQANPDGGYDLFVRKRPGLGSVLLTESTKDPALKADNFAYRSPAWNPVNGDEKRMLNGKALPASSGLYSLISSTPVPDPGFGEAFHVYIPPVLVYGYPWSRSGSVSVGKGTFINIRSFAKPYADYSGAFLDNPYEISIMTVARPAPVPEPEPAPPPPPVQGPPPLPPPDDRTSSKLLALVDDAVGKTIDLVVCLDTTSSMVPYFDELKKNLAPMLRARVGRYKSFRIGLVFFKDFWPEEYITRKYPFTADVGAVDGLIHSVDPKGGGDIPEAEFDALKAAVTDFDWQADVRQVILVTDAAPHPGDKGTIGFGEVAREAAARGIVLESLIEPAKAPEAEGVHEDLERITRRVLAQASTRSPTRLAAAALVRDGASGKAEPAPADAEALAAALAARTAGFATVTALGGPADRSALAAAAKAASADYLVLREETRYARAESQGRAPALREVVTRLVKLSSGDEVARDVLWITESASGQETLFVNGVRLR